MSSFDSFDCTGGDGKRGSSPPQPPSRRSIRRHPSESLLLFPDLYKNQAPESDCRRDGSCVKIARTTGTKGSKNRLDRRHSTGGIINWRHPVKAGALLLIGINDWIRSKVSMRTKLVMAGKRDSPSPEGRQVRINSMVDDRTSNSRPRLLLHRRHDEHQLIHEGRQSDAATMNGVCNLLNSQEGEEEVAVKTTNDAVHDEEWIKTSHPLSSSSDQSTTCHINFPISGEGGDKDEEQVQGITGQGIIAKEKKKSKQQPAKERRDVNGNFNSHQVTDASLTVNHRKGIVSLPASLPPSSFFENPVCESVIRKEQQEEQERQSGSNRIKERSHLQQQDRQRNHQIEISCICSNVKDQQLRPASVTRRSWMAGHDPASGSDQTHVEIQSSPTTVAATTGKELFDRCTPISLHIASVPDFKFLTSGTDEQPVFIRPSTSTSINSIVIDDACISDDLDNDSVSNNDNSSPDRHAKMVQERKASTSSKLAESETTWSVIKELILAFLLAGLGNVAASYWLAKVQSWSVFKNIPQLVILVPPLIGLKGNVEMTLASRLSTHANLGHMDTRSGRKSIIMGNMALIQCQASTVGFIAPIIALGLSLMSERARYLRWREIVLLVASSVITANVANLILGTLMCGVILMARKHHINPDNIATPIAASLGDVTTMILLANISHFLYVSLDTNQWVQNTLLAFLMSLIPIWAYIARNNPYTRKVIVNGWYPVCGAMLIQNAGGLVMERALKTFERIANLQLLINGMCVFMCLCDL